MSNFLGNGKFARCFFSYYYFLRGLCLPFELDINTLSTIEDGYYRQRA
jgi:hypothetical protein